MRRKDKKIQDSRVLDDIFLQNKVCRIGFVDDNSPYVISMNYGYRNNSLYVHSAPEGRKIDIIKKNNRVCVEISDAVQVIEAEKACNFTTKYRSLVCEGRIHLLSGLEEKRAALERIMQQHTQQSQWDMPDSAIKKIAVMKIELENISGKISG